MRSIYIIIIFFSLYIVPGCKKGYLDITPKGQMIPQTTDDYRKILDYISNKNSVGQTVAILQTYGIPNLLADDYQVSDSTQYKTMMNNDRKLWYNWGTTGGYDPERDDFDWRTTYGQIYIMNSAIEGLPKAEGTQADINALLAEAKFHRAFCYLGLVNIYARHYTSASAETDPGVPLRLTVSLTEELPRASVKAVYDQVLKDLTEALPNLKPSHGIYNFRPTSPAAHALLARTYLYMGNYEKVLEHSNESLKLNNFLYNLETELVRAVASRNRPAGELNAFATTFRSWDDKEILIQKETTYNTALYHYNSPTAYGPTLWALYDTTSDLRYINYFNRAASGDSSYTFTGTIRRWQDAFYYSQVGLSVPEMYLTRAEAYARTNKVAEAIADINALRSKRFKAAAYVPLVAASFTKEQALEFIKEERRRELWLRGVRWFDLKRYNALDNANITITRYFTGLQLKPGDEGWVVPIAELYLSINPEMRIP